MGERCAPHQGCPSFTTAAENQTKAVRPRGMFVVGETLRWTRGRRTRPEDATTQRRPQSPGQAPREPQEPRQRFPLHQAPGWKTVLRRVSRGTDASSSHPSLAENTHALWASHFITGNLSQRDIPECNQISVHKYGDHDVTDMVTKETGSKCLIRGD